MEYKVRGELDKFREIICPNCELCDYHKHVTPWFCQFLFEDSPKDFLVHVVYPVALAKTQIGGLEKIRDNSVFSYLFCSDPNACPLGDKCQGEPDQILSCYNFFLLQAGFEIDERLKPDIKERLKQEPSIELKRLLSGFGLKKRRKNKLKARIKSLASQIDPPIKGSNRKGNQKIPITTCFLISDNDDWRSKVYNILEA